MSITWNGVSSDTIGVIVERIPNRYVPTRRFSPQQVAGRNGNILLVDKSFPNVEQEYEVYLSAEAQGLPSVARACAEWLMGPDGYCRLEDSYDTTVYREAFLMGGYDLENILNKFGRCTITFSCKPQKYLLTGETPVTIPAGHTDTYTGSVVNFSGIAGATITSLSSGISPVQDLHGYSSPWPAGGGVNKFDEEMVLGILNNDGTVSPSTTRLVSKNFIPITAETQYSMSWDKPGSSTARARGAFYDSTETFLSYVGDLGSTPTEENGRLVTQFTTPQDAAYLKFCMFTSYGTTYKNDITIGLYNASTNGKYYPYSNICPISGRTGLSVYVGPTQDPDDATVYAVDWTTQAGTVYGGTVDVVTGLLTVDRVKKSASEATNWRNHTALNDGSGYYIYSPGFFPANGTKISNSHKQSFAGSWENMTFGEFIGTTSAIVTVPPEANTLALAKTYLESIGTYFVYPLATPQTYQLTTEQIEVLVGSNYIWSNAGSVSVAVAFPLGGTLTNPTPFEARPLLIVSGDGELTVNGKSIQILEAVSDFKIDCETMEADDNSKIYCMDFPDLSGGANAVIGSGTITALSIVPRWWTL